MAPPARSGISGRPESPAQLKVPQGAKVLILSGGQREHHGFRRQTELLQRLLEQTRQFETTICEDAAILVPVPWREMRPAVTRHRQAQVGREL